MESSHLPLHKWMQGFYLMASSKKGVSSERRLVRVRILSGADGEQLQPDHAGAAPVDYDLCRTCRDRLAREADPRNWPRHQFRATPFGLPTFTAAGRKPDRASADFSAAPSGASRAAANGVRTDP